MFPQQGVLRVTVFQSTSVSNNYDAAPMPSVAATDRVYAIGDVHGRLDLLTDLMQRLCADAETFDDDRQAKFVFLGDYIDRGEASKGVLDVLTQMAEMRSPNIVFLRGNHEDAMRAFLSSPTEGAEWLDFGGLQTLASFGLRPPALKLGRQDLFRVRSELIMAIAKYEPLFDAMVNTFQSGDVVFSHAGAKSDVPFDIQPKSALIWGRGVSKDDNPLPGLRVVHGHFDSDNPVSAHGRICVDTGAYYTNRLTAVRLDDGEAFLTSGIGV